MQPAGAGQGVEGGTAPCAGMAAEEQGVLPREGDVSVDSLDDVVVPGVVASNFFGTGSRVIYKSQSVNMLLKVIQPNLAIRF